MLEQLDGSGLQCNARTIAVGLQLRCSDATLDCNLKAKKTEMMIKSLSAESLHSLLLCHARLMSVIKTKGARVESELMIIGSRRAS